MKDTPEFQEVLKQAMQGVDSEDVRLFYDYFEELKRHACRFLCSKARVMPGASAVVASALSSLICDVALREVLDAVKDPALRSYVEGRVERLEGAGVAEGDDGRPALWARLLVYVERHCDKWKKWHKTKGRDGTEVSLHGAGDGSGTIEVEDYRAPGDEEGCYEERLQTAAFEALSARLTEEEIQVLMGRLGGESLAQIAKTIDRSENTVSNRLARIREVLETL
jgi:DNA-binding CsgD family transcriptional regulator